MILAGNSVNNISSTADASAVEFDSVLPTITSITIASNNNYDNDNNTSLAKAADSVTLTFYTSEVVQTPTSTIAQGTATVSGSQTSWTSTIAMDASDPDGAVAFTVDFSDLAGNAGTQVTSVTSGGNVTFDNTPPAISSVGISSDNAVNTLAKVGDQVTVSLTSNEDLYDLSSVQISGQSVDPALVTKTSATSWSFGYIMTENDAEGDVGFTVTSNDLTGNPTATAVADNGSVLFDRTVPTLSTVTISSNNTYDPSLATVGDMITVSFISSETVQDPPTVTIGGTSATVSGSGTTWALQESLHPLM